ncbi:MAG TPA: SGNH/GDSL hydrolase family protein [Flavitalea sp.]|nr:SGNH/GDSL hydrolase family protein [Flavitalea sp.]
MKSGKGISTKVLKTALYGLYLFFIVFLLLEVSLRIYQPFRFRIKADRILLPVNEKEIIRNRINPKLDPVIIVSRNSLGFRGPDTLLNFHEYLSIITVGGSTTECHFLGDEHTWPYLLGKELAHDFKKVWVNNAGLDGHSTFGHQILLDDHIKKIKPKVVLFLTGVNDIENSGPSYFDKLTIKNAYPDFIHYVYNNSEVINAAVNIARGQRANMFNNTTQEMKVPGAMGVLNLNQSEINEKLLKQQKFIDGYGTRIAALIDTCKQNDIMPVFVTQPCLYGHGTDSLTGVNLATAKVEEHMNGALLEALIDAYNNKMKAVCENRSAACIDLESMMPKCSLYYYDQTHYTNQGAEMVANLIGQKMRDILTGRY